jgi:Fic family protein
MDWIWQQPEWPDFTYRTSALDDLERRFLLQSGEFVGAFRHIGADDQDRLRIELIRDEALKTSEIEGELLNRDSVQSSLIQQFGLGKDGGKAGGKDGPRVPDAERGIAEMMVDLYRTFASPLADKMMFGWHAMLMAGEKGIEDVGTYRRQGDPMQIVSGPLHKRRVHFEAPPSTVVPKEMKAFVAWFNDSAPAGKHPLPPVTRAGIAHLYFECIHPFEDGNGRIGRAIAEKTLAQGLGRPTLIAMAYAIERRRKAYYAALELSNRGTEITDWLVFFANTVLEAQATTIERVDFYLAKARFYERLRGQMNERQERVVARMFREGLDGFKGGLSAENYITIAKTSRATATRDLQDLVAKGALSRTGELKHTRYHLAIAGKN